MGDVIKYGDLTGEVVQFSCAPPRSGSWLPITSSPFPTGTSLRPRGSAMSCLSLFPPPMPTIPTPLSPFYSSLHGEISALPDVESCDFLGLSNLGNIQWITYGVCGPSPPCKALCAARPWATSATGLRKMALPSLTRRWTYTQIEHTAKSRGACFLPMIMPGCRIFSVPPPGIYFIIYSAAASSIAAAACPTGGRTPPAGKSPSLSGFRKLRPAGIYQAFAAGAVHDPAQKSSIFRTASNRRYQGRVCPSMRPKVKMPPMPGHRRLPLDPGSSAISAPGCLPPEQGRIGLPSGSRPPGEKYRSPTPGPRPRIHRGGRMQVHR